MNTIALKVGGFLALALLIVPTGAEAYRFVESSAQKVSDTTYLLTHTYTAGFLNVDAQLPIVASLEYGEEDVYPRVGFSVQANSVALTGATVSALVLSDAKIQNNQYLTMTGKRDTFTLVALVTLDEPADAGTELSLSVQSLPFSYLKDGKLKTGSYAADVVELSVGNIEVDGTAAGK
jgi:hypothetical protein